VLGLGIEFLSITKKKTQKRKKHKKKPHSSLNNPCFPSHRTLSRKTKKQKEKKIIKG